MSINVYNCDAHPWFKNMILIARKSIINGISEKRFAANFKPVKNRCFSVATLDGTSIMDTSQRSVEKNQPLQFYIRVTTILEIKYHFRFTINY